MNLDFEYSTQEIGFLGPVAGKSVATLVVGADTPGVTLKLPENAVELAPGKYPVYLTRQKKPQIAAQALMHAIEAAGLGDDPNFCRKAGNYGVKEPTAKALRLAHAIQAM